MMQRLGLSAQIRKDSFSKYTLARALHVRVQRIEEWIGRGWLAASDLETGGVKRIIIEGKDFVQFCQDYTKEVVGDDLPLERLEFVCRYAFPPSHDDLLAVRESKKERAAYASQSEQEARQRKESASTQNLGGKNAALGATA
jgi:hypothetical protein